MNFVSNPLATLDSLDLEPIKVKLMHKSGEGWTLAHANAVEVEYRRFLYLRKAFPNEAIVPLEDVDTFWHYHILDTMKYAQDCQEFFGYFLHHFPYSGMLGAEDLAMHQHVAERTRALYEQAFGDNYYARAIASRKSESLGNAGLESKTTSFRVPGGGKISAAAANAAFCMLTDGGGTISAKGANAAFCMLTDGGGTGSAKNANAAFCMLTDGGGTVSAKGANAAFCMLTDGGGTVSVKDANVAFCMLTDGGGTISATGATAPSFVRPRLDS